MKPILLQGHERSITQIKYNREGDLLFTVAKDPVSDCVRAGGRGSGAGGPEGASSRRPDCGWTRFTACGREIFLISRENQPHTAVGWRQHSAREIWKGRVPSQGEENQETGREPRDRTGQNQVVCSIPLCFLWGLSFEAFALEAIN
uniref:Eukaryotic translation initiation factor 3 subunit I n=1 Tax=Mus musculus TaxID=10090 RepID=Q8BTM6_MOUSE|nr:unnamed protein product [Mus musculus]